MHSFYKMRNDLHDEWFFKNPQYLLWWGDLMHCACWKSETVMVGSIPISLHRGQLIASINDLVKRWDRSKDMIIKYIKVLETKGLIIKTTKNNISIITILDYDLEDDTDNLADTPEHIQNTDKQSTFKRLNGKQTDNLVDNLNTTDNLADNLADNLLPEKADNLEIVEYSHKQDVLGGSQWSETDNLSIMGTDNKADNLADNPYIYSKNIKERIFSPSTTTSPAHTRELGGLESDEIIAADAAELLKKDGQWISQMVRRHKMSAEYIIEWLDSFVCECSCRGKEGHESLSDFKQHFNDWLFKQEKLAADGKKKSSKCTKPATLSDPGQLWKLSLEEITKSVGSDGKAKVYDNVSFLNYDTSSKVILLGVPNKETYDYIEANFAQKMGRVLPKYFGCGFKLNYKILGKSANQSA